MNPWYLLDYFGLVNFTNNCNRVAMASACLSPDVVECLTDHVIYWKLRLIGFHDEFFFNHTSVQITLNSIIFHPP